MNKEEYYLELIEKQFENTLTTEEVEEFTKLSSDDSNFLSLYKNMQVIIAGVKNSGRNTLLAGLKKTEEQLPKIETGKGHSIRGIRWIVLAAAAACITGIIVIIGLVTTNKTNNYDRIYSDFYKPYSNLALSNYRSNDKTGPATVKEDAYKSYAEGNYTRAIGQFEQLKETNRDNEVLFFLANSYMAVGQFSKAEDNFNLVLTKESLLSDQAKWFLGLCYLKTNQHDKAKAEFTELTNYENAYMKNAKEILHLMK